MNRVYVALMLTAGCLTPAVAQTASNQPFTGRWDLTIKTAKDTYPSWMEFKDGGVRVVGRVASVHPATEVKVDGTHLAFTTSEWFDGEIRSPGR